MKLFLCAHDQVKEMQSLLQLGRYLGTFDKAAFAVTMPRKAPKVGAIVDVQRRARAMFARQSQGFQHRSFGLGVRQMRACGDDRARLGDEVFFYVIFTQRHVGAVFAVENQGKLLFIANAQQDQRCKPFRVGFYTARIHAFLGQFFQDKASHVFVANPRDQRRFQPQTRRARGHVGGRSADIFLERGHVFQPPADLRAIKIHRGSANRDDIKGFHGQGSQISAGPRLRGRTAILEFLF